MFVAARILSVDAGHPALRGGATILGLGRGAQLLLESGLLAAVVSTALGSSSDKSGSAVGGHSESAVCAVAKDHGRSTVLPCGWPRCCC